MSKHRTRTGRWLAAMALAFASLPLLQTTGCALSNAVIFELTRIVGNVVFGTVETITLNVI